MRCLRCENEALNGTILCPACQKKEYGNAKVSRCIVCNTSIPLGSSFCPDCLERESGIKPVKLTGKWGRF